MTQEEKEDDKDQEKDGNEGEGVEPVDGKPTVTWGGEEVIEEF